MRPKIALFINNPECSTSCANGMMKALDEQYRFKIFGRHPVERHFFRDVDIVAVPGGIGNSDRYDVLMKANGPLIKRFVDDGGRYLGICMGAYWAGHHYMDILTGVKAYQYIKRPRTDTHRPHPKALEVTWLGHQEMMYFYDGCSLVGSGGRFKTIATYPNGDPMAIFQKRIGLIGCHPESDRHWYYTHSWLRGHWHDYRHHQLLLDFVDELMER